MENLIGRWRKVPVAVAVDVCASACLIDPAIRPLKPAGQQPRLFGRAVTAACEPADLGAVLRALDVIQAGEVLVIAAQANREHAMIGGILCGHLRGKGVAGVVCDGAIRDVAELAAFEEFSVYSRFITPLGPTAFAGRGVNLPVMAGERQVCCGDLIIGDDDGVCALDPEMIRTRIDAAEKKIALEAQWISSLKNGLSAAETFGLES